MASSGARRGLVVNLQKCDAECRDRAHFKDFCQNNLMYFFFFLKNMPGEITNIN